MEIVNLLCDCSPFPYILTSLFLPSCTVHYVPDKLDDFINTLNGQLQPLSLEIRKGVSEENGRTYYALVRQGWLSPGVFSL